MGNLEKYSEKQAQLCIKYGEVDSELYNIYGVKRGLRDINGQGVVAGLTNISKITAFKTENGEKIPCDGELLYRGYDIQDLIIGNLGRKNIYEEGAYLLLFGELPNEEQLVEFKKMIADNMTLPTNFTRDVIMKAPDADIMSSMTKSILTLTMLILILVFYKAEIFRSYSESMILIILLGIMPVSAYGLQLILPNYKKSGREGQRKLAFITSLIGYSAAFIWAIFTDVKDSLLLICSTYFFSVVLLSISNKVIHFRASGHACSFAVPLVLLVHFFSWMMAIPCILMAVIIAWSSIYLKRHTIKELAGGIVTCLLAYGLSIGFVMIIN